MSDRLFFNVIVKLRGDGAIVQRLCYLGEIVGKVKVVRTNAIFNSLEFIVRLSSIVFCVRQTSRVHMSLALVAEINDQLLASVDFHLRHSKLPPISHVSIV